MSNCLKTPNKSAKLRKTSELEEFRKEWIDNVDRKFFQFCINSQEYSPSMNLDDGEVARLKTEFERLQRRLAISEKEIRRNEFFDYLPIQTCSSDQVLYCRNERLATSFNDIELLFVRDNDSESLLSDGSCSLHRFQHSGASHRSVRSQLNLLKKMSRFFKCW
ncbi:unnamed protein product [Allacma fusca]|uniref:Uncharacterized protein n=1 Tax=Allacma fusca TaxID=39272 RepID=A0A8J2P771_9HEXA|nr:unnamed protein product [Allacma fusca]